MSEIKVNSIKGTGASTAAITLDSSAGTCTANITNKPNRNLIINGAMQVAQRATTNNTTGAQSTYHTLDRFMTQISVGTITESQQDLATTDTPYTFGFRKYMRLLNQSGIGAATNQYLQIDQRIEAQDVAQSGWDYTSSSSFVTVSFWVRASVTQSYVGVLTSHDGTQRHYPFEISLTADQWTKITKTIPGNSGITVNNDNGIGLILSFIPYYGTQFTGGSGTFNAWNTTGSGLTRWPDMTTTWATTTNATFDVTGVQLEVGSFSSDFEFKSFGQELALCQRYYYRHVGGIIGDGQDSVGVGVMYANNNLFTYIYFPTTMRAKPSLEVVTGTSYYLVYSNDSNDGFNTFSSLWNSNENMSVLNAYSNDGISGRTAGHSSMVIANHNDAKVSFSAEL
tara:strand:+ start:418 stop:1605 length:1188 start_codon:yes stop_codon:yes gene_type:complete